MQEIVIIFSIKMQYFYIYPTIRIINKTIILFKREKIEKNSLGCLFIDIIIYYIRF